MKLQDFCDISQCRLVNIYYCFGAACCFLRQDPAGQEVCDLLDPEYGGTELRRNVGKYLPLDNV